MPGAGREEDEGVQAAGKLDHLSQVKRDERQSSSVSGWELEGRASDWLSLVRGDQGTVIVSPIGVSRVKVVPRNKTGAVVPRRGSHPRQANQDRPKSCKLGRELGTTPPKE